MAAKKKATTKKAETTTAEEPKKEEVKEVIPETVEVKSEDLKAFMKRLDDLESDNKRLMAAADKARLANIDAKLAEGQPLIRTVRLSRIHGEGPIIVAWKLTKNISYMDGNRMIEDQRMNVIFEDGTSKEMPLIDFYRGCDKKTVAEIISRKKNEQNGEEILEVEMKDGKRLEIPLKFVN